MLWKKRACLTCMGSSVHLLNAVPPLWGGRFDMEKKVRKTIAKGVTSSRSVCVLLSGESGLLAREWKKTGGRVRNHYSGLCGLASSLCLQLPSSRMSSQRLFQWTQPFLHDALSLVQGSHFSLAESHCGKGTCPGGSCGSCEGKDRTCSLCLTANP